MVFWKLGTSKTLHDLVRNKEWESAKNRCRTHPNEATEWRGEEFVDGSQSYSSRCLPIHLACSQNPPGELIDALLTAHPDSINETESYFHRLPIHIACRNGTSADAIRVLIERSPDSAHSTDNLNRAPLHYAVANGVELEGIECILENNPRATQVQDVRGWLPIHAACRMGASVEIIRSLLRVYPDSVYARTSRGNTPLMCAEMADTPNRDDILSLITEEMNKARKPMDRALAA